MDMGPGLFVIRWFSYGLAIVSFVASLYMYEKVSLTVWHSQDEFLNMGKYQDDLDCASWGVIGCISLALFGVWCQFMGEHLAAANIFFAIALCLLYLVVFAIFGCFISIWLRRVFEKAIYMLWCIRQHKVQSVTPENAPSIEELRQRAIIRSTIKHPFIFELRGFIKRTAKSGLIVCRKFVSKIKKFFGKIPFNGFKEAIRSKFARK